MAYLIDKSRGPVLYMACHINKSTNIQKYNVEYLLCIAIYIAYVYFIDKSMGQALYMAYINTKVGDPFYTAPTSRQK